MPLKQEALTWISSDNHQQKHYTWAPIWWPSTSLIIFVCHELCCHWSLSCANVGRTLLPGAQSLTKHQTIGSSLRFIPFTLHSLPPIINRSSHSPKLKLTISTASQRFLLFGYLFWARNHFKRFYLLSQTQVSCVWFGWADEMLFLMISVPNKDYIRFWERTASLKLY